MEFSLPWPDEQNLEFYCESLRANRYDLKKYSDNRQMAMQDRRMDMAANISVLSTFLYRSLTDDQSHKTYYFVGARTVSLFYFTAALFSYNKCQDRTSDSTSSTSLGLFTRPIISLTSQLSESTCFSPQNKSLSSIAMKKYVRSALQV